MKILIIWEEIPETTKLYSVEVTEDEWRWMQLAHGHYVNTVIKDKFIEKAVLALSNWLVEKTPHVSKEPIRAEGGYDYILQAGFVL